MSNLTQQYEYSDLVGEAWQSKIRKEKQILEQDNRYWEGVNLSLKATTVRPIDFNLAKQIVLEYEWLGCMPAITRYCFGIFFEDLCGGVVVFGDEYSENTGVWDKYGFTGKMLLLSRGVCLHWTPKNTASKLIMGAIKQLPAQYEIITATTDNLAGEIGTIYQACNFYYVGAMRKTKTRNALILGGKLYGSRSIKSKFGHRRKEDLLREHPEIVFVKQKSKDRYFLFRSNKEAHYKAIAYLIKPYPKRGTGL